MIFVKYPEPGRVKTRLAASVGAEAAAEIYRRMVAHVFRQFPPNQAVRVLYDTFRPETDYRVWLQDVAPPDAEFVGQAEGDLGDRLGAAFARALSDGWARIGVIGSDCLELKPSHYESAWHALEAHDLVLGPTFDGGYYFLALKTLAPELFRDISWSTEVVYAQTCAAAGKRGMTFFDLPKLNDVDTLADWEREAARI